MSSYAEERAFAISTAVEAGLEIRRIYESNSAAIYIKADASPVTDADLASDAIIRRRIAKAFPEDAILTEEGIDDTARLSAERVWIADPIDGTQQFINRTGQFDVLLALVIEGRPVVSVALQPATGMYLAAEKDSGAILGFADNSESIPIRLADATGPVQTVTTIWFGAPESTYHLGRIVQRIGLEQPTILDTGVIARGHLDPHIELIAGRDDLALALGYPSPAHAMIGLPMRGDGTMAWEWDYAASDLIINEAGGRFTDWYGDEFRYNKPVPRNEGGLVISNSPELHARLLAAIAPEIELVNHSRREK